MLICSVQESLKCDSMPFVMLFLLYVTFFLVLGTIAAPITLFNFKVSDAHVFREFSGCFMVLPSCQASCIIDASLFISKYLMNCITLNTISIPKGGGRPSSPCVAVIWDFLCRLSIDLHIDLEIFKFLHSSRPTQPIT